MRTKRSDLVDKEDKKYGGILMFRGEQEDEKYRKILMFRGEQEEGNKNVNS